MAEITVQGRLQQIELEATATVETAWKSFDSYVRTTFPKQRQTWAQLTKTLKDL